MIRTITRLFGSSSDPEASGAGGASGHRSHQAIEAELARMEKALARLAKKRQSLGTYVSQDDGAAEEAYLDTQNRVAALRQELEGVSRR